MMTKESVAKVEAAMAEVDAGTPIESVLPSLSDEELFLFETAMENTLQIWAEDMARRGMKVPDRPPFKRPKPS